MKINSTHGNGGRETTKLINTVFMKYFKNSIGSAEEDAAVLNTCGTTAFTTDSFVINPIFFKGGDIGRLAVCGTVNDLLTTGAVPKYLSAGFIIEEGFELDDLDKIACSMAQAAAESGVQIVTGDTKVVDGNGRIYINTSGIGELDGDCFSFKNAQAGDALIVTGTLGDHHACIMSARMGIQNNIKSDSAPLNSIVNSLKANNITIHGIRDITRGGLATCLNEISALCRLRACIHEHLVPVSREVAGLCEILGLDPLYMANEGKMLIAVPSHDAKKAVKIIQEGKYGQDAVFLGEFHIPDGEPKSNFQGMCDNNELFPIITTKIGGRRYLPPLTGETLPRIC